MIDGLSADRVVDSLHYVMRACHGGHSTNKHSVQLLPQIFPVELVLSIHENPPITDRPGIIIVDHEMVLDTMWGQIRIKAAEEELGLDL